MTSITRELIEGIEAPGASSTTPDSQGLAREADEFIAANWPSSNNLLQIPAQFRQAIYLVYARPVWMTPDARRAAEVIANLQYQISTTASSRRSDSMAQINRLIRELAAR